MAEPAQAQENASKKKSKVPLLLGIVLMFALAGGGFFAVYSGLILAPDTSGHDIASTNGDSQSERNPDGPILPLEEVAFIPLQPLVINLGAAASTRYLRFRAQLEIVPAYEAEVTAILPRVLDVLNSYLRAVDITDLEDPTALARIRAQMLRRVKIVTGEGRVRDILIMEFVLN